MLRNLRIRNGIYITLAAFLLALAGAPNEAQAQWRNDEADNLPGTSLSPLAIAAISVFAVAGIVAVYKLAKNSKKEQAQPETKEGVTEKEQQARPDSLRNLEQKEPQVLFMQSADEEALSLACGINTSGDRLKNRPKALSARRFDAISDGSPIFDLAVTR